MALVVSAVVVVLPALSVTVVEALRFEPVLPLAIYSWLSGCLRFLGAEPSPKALKSKALPGYRSTVSDPRRLLRASQVAVRVSPAINSRRRWHHQADAIGDSSRLVIGRTVDSACCCGCKPALSVGGADNEGWRCRVNLRQYTAAVQASRCFQWR